MRFTNPASQRYSNGGSLRGLADTIKNNAGPVAKAAAQFAAPILADTAKAYLKSKVAGGDLVAANKNYGSLYSTQAGEIPSIPSNKIYSGSGTYRMVRSTKKK